MVVVCSPALESIFRRAFAVDYILHGGDSQAMPRDRDEAPIREAFAAVLKELRVQLGVSQEQLALMANVDRTFIGKLESGRNQPSLGVIFAIAHAVGTTPEKLVARVQQRLAST